MLRKILCKLGLHRWTVWVWSNFSWAVGERYRYCTICGKFQYDQ